MTKGKRIEYCTEVTKLEASTEEKKMGGSTKGRGSSGNIRCSTGSLRLAALVPTTSLYAFLCIFYLLSRGLQ